MLFDIGWSELLLIGVVALIFIGPKDLPRALRIAGYWVGRARTLSREFQSSVDQMIREAELEEMEKKWREENERIMSLHPAEAHYPEPNQPEIGQPDEMPPIAEVPEPTLPFAETQPEDELPPEKRPLP